MLRINYMLAAKACRRHDKIIINSLFCMLKPSLSMFLMIENLVFNDNVGFC